MPIALSNAYQAKLREGSNTPNTVIEVIYSSVIPQIADGTYIADGSILATGESDVTERSVLYGHHTDNNPDIKPILGNVSSIPNTIDTKEGFTTRGSLSFALQGRENFKQIIKDEYLKNRTVKRHEGFLGIDFSEYVNNYTGKITAYSSDQDELTINVSDDLIDGKKKIPVSDGTLSQSLNYTGMNPVDIILAILNELNIPSSLIDTTQIENERDTWHALTVFSRVITEPIEANDLFNELQIQTNSYLIFDGQKIVLKTFAPVAPNTPVSKWSDRNTIDIDSITLESGYQDQFFNNVVIYFDYNESGSDDLVNYKTVLAAIDTDSISPTQWDETETKIIKSKWLRSFEYTQPAEISGVTIFHSSNPNGTGNGTLIYTKLTNSITWKAPGGGDGAAVVLNEDGKYDIFDANGTKFIRILVDISSLPISDKTDTIIINTLNAETYARTFARRMLARFVNPVPKIKFTVNSNEINDGGNLRIPSSLVDITSDEMLYKGIDSFVDENCIINSLINDSSIGKLSIEIAPTKLSKKFGFIAPAGQANYPVATDEEKQYAYIGDFNNQLDSATVDGNYIY